MADRVYEVAEQVGVWAVGYVRASSREEAVEKARSGGVTFTTRRGQTITKLRARLLRGEEALAHDPVGVDTPSVARHTAAT